MKNKILIIFLLVISFFMVSCTKEKEVYTKPVEKELTEDEKLDQYVKEQLSNMSLNDKIGQMLMISYEGVNFDKELEDILNIVHPGGFILFSDNFDTFEKTKKFIENINQTASIPLFWSIDQEGGTVQRLKSLKDKKVTILPEAYEIGKTKNTEISRELGRVAGEELRVFGINMNFAPVLDIYSNPLNTVIGHRAFGTNASIVSKMALSFGEGLKSTGIIPVYKHFPGHGDTKEDSHKDLPIINKTKEKLYEQELIPFIDAIESGAEAIMVGHLAIPKITGSNIPATLSKEIITDLLIDELGFEGLIITDALDMGALGNNYSIEEIYENAILAGNDILLMPDPLEANSIITKLVENGTISIDRINSSVYKILKYKYTHLENIPTYDETYLGSSEHVKIVENLQKTR